MKKERKTIILSSFVISLMFACVVFMQFKSATQTNLTDIQNMNEDELKKEILNWKNKYEDSQKKLDDINKKIKEYDENISNGENNSSLLESEYQDVIKNAGLTDVQGNGIIIKLQDNDEQRISSNHLVELVNELKYAGAEAISINDNRVINFTDIVDVNYVIMINGIKISSPYEVKAIGNITYLSSTLNAKDGYITTYKNTDLDIEFEEKKSVFIPRYNKELKLKYSVKE